MWRDIRFGGTGETLCMCMSADGCMCWMSVKYVQTGNRLLLSEKHRNENSFKIHRPPTIYIYIYSWLLLCSLLGRSSSVFLIFSKPRSHAQLHSNTQTLTWTCFHLHSIYFWLITRSLKLNDGSETQWIKQQFRNSFEIVLDHIKYIDISLRAAACSYFETT